MKKIKILLMTLLLFALAFTFASCKKDETPEKCTSHSYEVSVNPTYDTTGTLKCKNKNCDATETLPALKDRNSYYSSTSGDSSYTVSFVYGDKSFDFEQSYYLFEDINANEVALKEIIGCGSNKIVIPNEYNGKKVVKINSTAFEKARAESWQLLEIRMPSTVTEIEGNVIAGLTWIRTSEPTTVEFPLNFTMSDLFGSDIPSEITSVVFNNGNVIKTNTLSGSNVTSFEIPKTVTKIEQNAFDYTDNISWGTGVYYNGTIADWCNIEFENEKANPLFDGGSIALKDANNEWRAVEKLIIPETVTSIKDYTFKGCNSIKTVVIPSSVEYVGRESFAYCYYLETVILGNGIKTVGRENNECPFRGAEVQKVYFLGTYAELDTIRKNAYTSFDKVFDRSGHATTYYYSKELDLRVGGYDTWRYNANGEPDVWDIKWQDYYFGKDSYSYVKTEVEITDEAWNELVSKKGTSELNALLNNDTSVINAFNESASKEEFKSKVETIFTTKNANFTVQFGKLGVIDYFTDSRTNNDYNFKAVSVEGVFGAYSYNEYNLYLTEVEEGVISLIEQGYIININNIMNINE